LRTLPAIVHPDAQADGAVLKLLYALKQSQQRLDTGPSGEFDEFFGTNLSGGNQRSGSKVKRYNPATGRLE
jgi:hypothetical protein